jgi:hypothetical protein
MKTLLILVVLFVIAIAGVGFNRGWFRLSTDTTNRQPSATVTVDKEKIRQDEQKAKAKVQGMEQAAKEKTEDWAGKARR